MNLISNHIKDEKPLKSLLLILIISALLSGCRSSKETTGGIEEIEFGSGGGFAGRVVTYTLNIKQKTLKYPDGTVKQTGQSDMDKITAMLSDSDITELKFSHPYNMYNFVVFHTKENNKKLVWGDPEYPAPDELKEFYNLLMSIVKGQEE